MQQHGIVSSTVLQCLHPYLRPLDIARLSCAGKSCQYVVRHVLRNYYRGFLPQWVDTAAGARAVLWLCDSAQQCHLATLELPNVPYSLAEQLVARGFRPTYEQITQVAEGRVEGAEVWIRALTGCLDFCPMPVNVLASALCTPDPPLVAFKQELKSVSPDAVAGLLHLAVNANRPDAAVALLEHLQPSGITDPVPAVPHAQQAEQQQEDSDQQLLSAQQQQQLTVELLEELLTTAASRPQHNKRHIIGFDENNQYIYDDPAPILEKLTELCQQAKVHSDATAKAITAAAQCGNDAVVTTLVELLNAAEFAVLPERQQIQLIRVLTPKWPMQAAQWLKSTPNTTQVPGNVIVELLSSALLRNSCDAFEQTCVFISSRSGSAVRFSHSDLEHIFGLVIEKCEPKGLQLLMQHMPESQLRRLDSETVRGWLVIALQQNHDEASELVSLLCLLPGAKLMPAGCVQGLMQLAIGQHNAVALDSLRSLKGLN